MMSGSRRAGIKIPDPEDDESSYSPQPYPRHFPYPIYPPPVLPTRPTNYSAEDPLVGKYVYVVRSSNYTSKT